MDVAGPIPEELWTLSYLFHLDLSKNYLSGSLSPSIGNLTRLKYLNVGTNALSGELPKEMGKLMNLLFLSIAENYFSGPLPSELGNLSKLQELYINSSGVSGEIPSTFANLQNLETVWASDTELTGRVPDFIGNWLKLKSLRLQGNAFEGSIPLTFSALTSLLELRVSDLTNGNSSLDFIKDMKNLTVLVLRNNNISNSIPSSLGEYQKLSELDLSFNSITGEIPHSLFNMSSLYFLFLGNNKLNGSLPQKKACVLVDLSYNNLAGNIPSWVNQRNLELNLVGNNFTVESLNRSVRTSGLKCLQQNFRCNQGHETYKILAINCGGQEIISSDRLVYERDNEILGPATYFVSNFKRWAVSNVGHFTGKTNPYISFSPRQFTKTLDSELFQTSRLSASSLRYYGLGLENGNYTVNLQFAEVAFDDSSSWRSLGRRVFDIYIQGRLVLKNFNIRKEADGIASQSVHMIFKAQVLKNYLEIHLFWAGKGTSSIPIEGTYGPSSSAISATLDFDPTVNIKPTTFKRKRTSPAVGIGIGSGVLSILFILMISYVVQRRKKSKTNDNEELLGLDVRPFTFSYNELKMATNNFSSDNKLGEGGFGPVYKGTLRDGRVVAVKQLSETSHQGKNQFVTEIATISAVQHRNLVKLYGCCLDGNNRLLVYEYMENKSLDQALLGNNSLNLNWSSRYSICLGIARGLAYLHEESRLQIVHRDVKASNILLDSDLIPKISDFGLARLNDNEKTHISTRVGGTVGYLAPEYAMHGYLTDKTDVFAFGVVALEIVSGRANSDSNLDEEKTYLLGWAWNLYKEKKEVELVDSALLSEFNEQEVRRVIRVALLCTQSSPSLRPSMSRVVAMLSGDVQASTTISKPGYLTDYWKSDHLSSQMSDSTAAKRTNISSYNDNASTSTTMVDDAERSFVNSNQYSMFYSSISEGR
ncbi:probable LRR receptor-like serine/threonine-protein kinase At1g56140 [Ziziphus jujuba]|uniref:non-specific serine/threonine protein kinase n=1 Tax=Ziziphus jujuba TaxID=326968 RepID=A0ABM4A116_ZIZJJ|nr:probable LRR receptor-like serine/threonine-protein kinase At1g56140 [Ziziphus jujuba]